MTAASNQVQRRTRLLRWVALSALLILPACAPFATYPPDGDGPNTYPWMAPGPEVMATGLMQAHARIAPDSPFVYNLPPGISRMAWDDVQVRLGADARPMEPGDKVVWDLQRFGVRNTRAFADIGYWDNGKAVLITVSMERENIAPFKVTHVQRWYVSLTPPESNAPAKDTAPEKTTEGDAASDSAESGAAVK